MNSINHYSGVENVPLIYSNDIDIKDTTVTAYSVSSLDIYIEFDT
jgi:hypothetical protein